MKNFLKQLILVLRIWRYGFLSTIANKEGKPVRIQPTLLEGAGSIFFGNNVSFGIYQSPYLLSGYGYIEARGEDAVIVFEHDVAINNSCVITAEKKITISKHTVIGYNCHISDSYFHHLDPQKRSETDPEPQEVFIGENVFMGNNVTVLKGVRLGKNVVVGSGAIVTKSFPDDVVIAGIPAKIIRTI